MTDPYSVPKTKYSKKGGGSAGRKPRGRSQAPDPGDKEYTGWMKKPKQVDLSQVPAEAIPDDYYTADGQKVKDLAQEARDKKTAELLAPPANEKIQAPARPGITGAVSKAYGADASKKYIVQYEVRELDDLVASNTESGAINPEYPAELQPRDRTRAASLAQVVKIGSTLEPDLLIEEFHSTDRGAPIIGPDGVVESGNGRVSALRRAALDYPERYKEYKTELTERAAERGLDPGELGKFNKPVLVRVRMGEAGNRVEFARDANTAAVLGMSAAEQSRTDADRLATKDIINFKTGTGSLAADITRRDNRDFVRSFMSSIPETERAALMGSGGELTQAGEKRIQAAMFTRVYKSPDLAAIHFESTDSNVKNITGGLMDSLGQMARAEEMINTGQRSADLSITGDIVTAVKTYKQIKDDPNITIEMYQDQKQMFESDDLNPTQREILGALHERRRSKKQVTEFISAWSVAVEKQPHPEQGNLFDFDARPDRDELVGSWIEGKYLSVQDELF